MLNLPPSFNRELDVPDRAIRTKKDKRTANTTGRSKTIPVCRWHNFIYGKYKDYTKNVRTDKINRIIVYKINVKNQWFYF